MLSASQTPAAPADFSHLLYKSLCFRVTDFQPQPGPGSASPEPAESCSGSSRRAATVPLPAASASSSALPAKTCSKKNNT